MPAVSKPPGTGYDIVSDVHGCLPELEELLIGLGYAPPASRSSVAWSPSPGRHLVFAGDLVDRGPAILDTVDLVMAMIGAGDASAVVGNHDDKLLRWLRGHPVKVSQGLEASIRDVEARPEAYSARLEEFLASLPSHLVLDAGRLVVAHAGLPERLHGIENAKARDFAMYGAVRDGRDEWGFPIRLDWAADYGGAALIVYGHTPVITPVWSNRTIDIDTGCVFGNTLTALRYPELDVVSVPARHVYQEKGGPFRRRGPGGAPVEWQPVARAG
jgi:protein phosphatase